MTRKKIHIDELFRNKLRSLSLLVSNKDMEAIDDKKSQYTETTTPEKLSAFSDFELEVNESDWLTTKNKLDAQRASLSQGNHLQKQFDDFSIEPTADDWSITYQKYLAAKSRKLWWWLGTGVFLILLGTSFLWTYLSSVNEPNIIADSKTAQAQVNTSHQTEAQVTEKESNSVETAQGHSLIENKKRNGVRARSKSPESVKGSELKPSKISKQFAQIQSNHQFNPNSTTDESKGIKQSENLGLAHVPFTIDQNTRQNILNSQLENKIELNNDPEPVNIESKESDLAKAIDSSKKSKDNLKPTNPPKGKLIWYLSLNNQLELNTRILSNTNNSFYNRVRKDADRVGVTWMKGFEIGIKKSKNHFSMGFQVGVQNNVSHYQYRYKVYDSLPVYNPGRTKIIGYFLLHGRDTVIDEMNQVRFTKIQIPLAFNRLVTISSATHLILGTQLNMELRSGFVGSKLLNPVNQQLYGYQRLQKMERSFNILPTLSVGLQQSLGKNLYLQSSFMGNMAVWNRFKPSFGAKEHNINLGINIKLLYLIQ